MDALTALTTAHQAQTTASALLESSLSEVQQTAARTAIKLDALEVDRTALRERTEALQVRKEGTYRSRDSRTMKGGGGRGF